MKKKLDITGLALIEGVMIKHEGEYAMALRKGNSDIEIIHDVYKGILGRGSFSKIPVLRGIFALIDYLILGIKLFLFSSDYHEDNGHEEPKAFEKICQKLMGKYHESVEMALFITLSLVFAILGFVILPYQVSFFIAGKFVPDFTKMIIIEVALRIVMVFLYIGIFCLNSDIRRLCSYHGAQHKVINCLRRGDMLTIKNVRKSSKYDKNCELNFVLYVIIISAVLFSFVRNNDMWVRMGIRVLIIPVVAAILYEIMNIVNKANNGLAEMLQFPQIMLQKLITREPTEEIMEVAIESVTAAFDWREYLGLEPLEEEEDYTKNSYEDNVTRGGNYTVEASGSQLLYDENLTQDYKAVKSDNFGYTNVKQDYYSSDTYNYKVPSYDHNHYDYSQQYFVDSNGQENSAYTAVNDAMTRQPGAYEEVLNKEITKRPGHDYSNKYAEVSYDELYNSFTSGEDISNNYANMYREHNNDYSNMQYNNYDGNNYQSNNYQNDNYGQSYGYNADGKMNNNYIEDNEDLNSLDRYFGDDNY